MSMRSANNLNVKNLPAKSTLKKEKKIPYSNTPIRLGEMEVTNLMIPKKPEVVESFLKSYSTNQEVREQLILQLLKPELYGSKNPLDMDFKTDLSDNRAISRELLDKYFNVLGYTLVDTIEDEEE